MGILSAASLAPKTKLALMRSLREKQGRLARGFTLIELMIVVAVVGILSAVALPNFLGARAAADAGAKVGEALGLGKECANYMASGGIGVEPTAAGNVTCATGADGSVQRSFTAGAGGVKCLSDVSTTTSNKVTVTIVGGVGTTNIGALSCSFS